MSEVDTTKELIAFRLREARKMAGLSQTGVAKLLDIQRPTISEIEGGNRRVTADEIKLFAQIYDVSVVWLLGEGTDKLDVHDAKLELAARELKKLKHDDLDRLLTILASIRDE